MQNPKKKPYEAPIITVVSFKVEQGYAASVNSLQDLQMGFYDGTMQGRSEDNEWHATGLGSGDTYEGYF